MTMTVPKEQRFKDEKNMRVNTNINCDSNLKQKYDHLSLHTIECLQYIKFQGTCYIILKHTDYILIILK